MFYFSAKVPDHNYKTQGKKNRQSGARFELQVRKHLEKTGWIVSKWGNNINLDTDKLIQAKSNRFNMRNMGFPDFIAFRTRQTRIDLIAVEVKTNGYLKPEEREKCQWYLKHKTFPKIYIAFKNRERKIQYKLFLI